MNDARPTIMGIRTPEKLASLWAWRKHTLVHLGVIALLGGLTFASSLRDGAKQEELQRLLAISNAEQFAYELFFLSGPESGSSFERFTSDEPLARLSLRIIGQSLLAQHACQLALQLLAASLVYLVARRARELALRTDSADLSDVGAFAFSVAVLFAVHPLSGLVMHDLTRRGQLLGFVLFQSALLAYLRMHERAFTRRGWLLVGTLVASSMLASRDGLLAPLVILALELTVLRAPTNDSAVWLRAATLIVPVAIGVAVPWLSLGSLIVRADGVQVSTWSYAWTQAQVHLSYLWHFVWPFELHEGRYAPLLKGFDAVALLGLLTFASSLIAAWVLRHREPLISFCICAYWLPLAPTSSWFAFSHTAVDARPYAASVWLWIAAQQLFHRFVPRHRAPLTAAAACVFALASLSTNALWRNDTALWKHSVEHGASAEAHRKLAMAIPSLSERQELLERAATLQPRDALAALNLGEVAVARGMVEQGLATLERVAALHPWAAATHYAYSKTALSYQQPSAAARHGLTAARLQPHDPRIVYNAALSLQSANEHEQALHWLDVLEHLSSPPPELGFARAFSLQQLGRLDEATHAYQSFLTFWPSHTQARFNYGFALLQLQQWAASKQEFERALSLDPKITSAHLHIATCARALGDDMAAQFHQALWDRNQRAQEP